MTHKSLNQIMNDMASGALDVHFLCFDASNDHAPQTLNELDAFIHIDETLADLNKEYLDEKSHYEYLVKNFGADDAMVEVAEDMMDSAWCAMQTRYLEVREEQKLMQQAQLMILAVEKEQIELTEKKEREKDIAQAERFAMMSRVMEGRRTKNKTNYADLLAVVLILFGVTPFINNFFQFRSSFNAHQIAAA